MAGSRFEYVRKFESGNDVCLLNTYMVVRIDGRGFHMFTTEHGFSKPNDERALNLMNCCAMECVKHFSDIVLAYGQSDEYSFVFRKSSSLFNRRASKIISCMVSLFASKYVMSWSEFMSDCVLKVPPQFDGRVVTYPSYKNMQDYFSWRQADCHINNLYNTCFWNLVKQKKLTHVEAKDRLSGTVSKDKNELLFSEFGINYNNEPIMFRKGSTIMWTEIAEPKVDTIKTVREMESDKNVNTKLMRGKKRPKKKIFLSHVDMIKDSFWIGKEESFD
mmetsp:Transcript_14721/g.17205  ORF Transcript_14721/g.17205 Transcript_14721/m.17205 type:complete len:275 (-) Transcript_14721:965-1789(-)